MLYGFTFTVIGDNFDVEITLPTDLSEYDMPLSDARVYQHGTETEVDIYELNKLVEMYNNFTDYTRCKVEAIMEAYDTTIDRAIMYHDNYDYIQDELVDGYINTSWGAIRKKER